MTQEFQEIPPTQHPVFGLTETGPTSNRCSHISCHVLDSLLEREIKEPPTHIYHAPYNIIRDAMIYQLHQYNTTNFSITIL